MLTRDEFALWLNMDENDYWNFEGRKSVDAVVLFAALLSLGARRAPSSSTSPASIDLAAAGVCCLSVGGDRRRRPREL
jgi:hypothetical protein